MVAVRVVQSVLVVAAGAVIVLLILWAYHWDGSGFGESFSKPKNPQGLRDYYPSKTLWDWMQLLLVPAVLAAAAAWLNWRQARREERGADRREQDAVLDSYLTQVGDLLLHEKLGDSSNQQAQTGDDNARFVARAQTITAVRRLDSGRTAIMVRFLSESNLIGVVDLSQANLERADLGQADLKGADLRRATLRQTGLIQANLARANLSWADLTGATLSYADLTGAQLDVAKLRGVDLRLANLRDANMTAVDLTGANLTGADLTRANLHGADLTKAILRGANLLEAELTEANLAGTNLRDVRGTRQDQLAQAQSLQGATMPDGSTHP